MTALALPPASSAAATATSCPSIRWDRVSAARAKVSAGGYDRINDAQLDAILQAMLPCPDNALAG